MKAVLYNNEKKKIGELELPDRIFKVRWNPTLVHQVLTAQIATRRVPLAHTKGRGEVRGGGRKPWRQKHTGRARVGSIRSPIWVGGGVAHGPTRERNFEKKVNKKMKRLALFSILSKKLKDGEILFLDKFNLTDHKTKNMVSIFKRLFDKPSSVLCIPEKNGRNVYLAARNIPKTKVLNPESISVYDCLAYRRLVIEKGAVSELENIYK